MKYNKQQIREFAVHTMNIVCTLLCYFITFASCDQLPEYSSVEDLPDYYPSYLDGRIEKINEAIAECSEELMEKASKPLVKMLELAK